MLTMQFSGRHRPKALSCGLPAQRLEWVAICFRVFGFHLLNIPFSVDLTQALSKYPGEIERNLGRLFGASERRAES
jgi:hypothetical protein